MVSDQPLSPGLSRRSAEGEGAAPAVPDRSRIRYLLTPSLRGTFRGGDVVLIDLSVTGIRVRHRERLFRGDAGNLTFVPLPGAPPVTSSGTISWCYRADDGSDPDRPFVAGIEAPIPEPVVTMLAQQDRATPIQELRHTDRYILTPHQPGSFQSDVLVLDLSETGARIRESKPVRPATHGVFRLAVPAANLKVRVGATVAWSRIDNSQGISYLAGLSFDGPDPEIRAAVARMSEDRLAHIDLESLSVKQRILRTRAVERGRRLRQVTQITMIDPETALLVRHVRQQLRTNPEEATRWYNKARYAEADPKVREILDPTVPFRDEMLALWEYLDRTVDLWKIVRICTDEA